MTHPLFARKHTIGEFYDAVFAIHDGAQARAFYEEYVAWLTVQPDLDQPAEGVAKANIGWVFGEGMAEADILMWAEACGASHPVFGEQVLRITPEDAFRAGIEKGAAS